VVGGCGILILGAPGSGKSDLALRLIDQPGRGTGPETMTARLVADDQVVITRRGARLFAAPPARLAGLIEVRGIGIVAADHAPEAEVTLAVRLADAGDHRAPAGERIASGAPRRRRARNRGRCRDRFGACPHPRRARGGPARPREKPAGVGMTDKSADSSLQFVGRTDKMAPGSRQQGFT
jgi:hypothetical protein